MSWNSLSPEVQQLAEDVLTEKQLQAWKLELAGLSLHEISRHLDLSRAAIKERLDGAYRKLRKSGLTQDGSGAWSL